MIHCRLVDSWLLICAVDTCVLNQRLPIFLCSSFYSVRVSSAITNSFNLILSHIHHVAHTTPNHTHITHVHYTHIHTHTHTHTFTAIVPSATSATMSLWKLCMTATDHCAWTFPLRSKFSGGVPVPTSGWSSFILHGWTWSKQKGWDNGGVKRQLSPPHCLLP